MVMCVFTSVGLLPATAASFTLFASSQNGSTKGSGTVVLPPSQELNPTRTDALERWQRISELTTSRRTPKKTAQPVRRSTVDLVYERYVELMLSIGVDEESLVDRRGFVRPDRIDGRNIIYAQFLEIETQGLLPGKEFVHTHYRKTYTVKTITPDARIVPDPESQAETFSPFDCAVKRQKQSDPDIGQ